MKKALDITKPRYSSEQTLPVPRTFVITSFHCIFVIYFITFVILEFFFCFACIRRSVVNKANRLNKYGGSVCCFGRWTGCGIPSADRRNYLETKTGDEG